jgi:hypothetical protein
MHSAFPMSTFFQQTFFFFFVLYSFKLSILVCLTYCDHSFFEFFTLTPWRTTTLNEHLIRHDQTRGTLDLFPDVFHGNNRSRLSFHLARGPVLLAYLLPFFYDYLSITFWIEEAFHTTRITRHAQNIQVIYATWTGLQFYHLEMPLHHLSTFLRGETVAG